MMGAVIRLPDISEGYALSRSILRRPVATPEQIDAALDVLDHSREWVDIDLVQKMRRQIARDALAAKRRAAFAEEQSAIRTAKVQFIHDEVMGAIGFVLFVAVVVVVRLAA